MSLYLQIKMEIKIASAQTDNPQDLTQLQINALRDKLGLYSYLKVVDMVEGDRPEDRYNTQPTFFLADPGQTLLKFVVFDAVTYLPKYVDLYKLITAGNLVPGDFGSNGQQIFNTNLEYINRRSITQADVGGAAVVVDFGDLGSTSVVAHINTLEPGLELVATQTNLTIIKAIVDNTAVSYLYNGVLATYGASATEFVESMLEPLEIEAQLLESGELLLDESTGGFYLKYQNRDIFEPLGFGALDLQGRWDENVQAGAAGTYAIATGLDNYVSGYAAAVFGYLNRVLGNYSVAFGSRNNANGSSHAFIAGNLNTAEGENNVIFGQRNVTNGDVAFTAGTDNEVNGSFSSAIGGYLRTDDAYEVAVGYGNFHILREDPGANDTREGDVIFHVGVGYQRSAPLSQLICYRGGLIRLTPIDLLNAEWNQNTPGGITGMWGIDSADGNKMKYHNGTEWVTLGGTPTSVGQNSITFINVKDLGVVGDGIVDDREAIQTVIDNNPNSTLYFPSGTYRVSKTALQTYSLLISSSINLYLENDARILLDESEVVNVSILQIGDGVTAIENVNINGGIIDGNAVLSGQSYGVGIGGINISGDNKNINITNLKVDNVIGVGVFCRGKSNSERAENINFKNCSVTNCGEGVRFELTDRFIWDGGQITDMNSQDCFEPHGGLDGWILRNCFVARPSSDNSAIEIFSQHGDVNNGLIENCVIPSDIRIQVGSGTGELDAIATNITIRNNDMTNGGNITSAINGKVGNLKICDNILVGPASTGTIYRFHGMEIGQCDELVIQGNKVSNFDRNGITFNSNYALIENNKCFNNGQDTGFSMVERCGIKKAGGAINCKIVGNHLHDNQNSPTQTYGLNIDSGQKTTVVDNRFENQAIAPLRYGTQTFTSLANEITNKEDYIDRNIGILTRKTIRVFIGSGSTFVNIPEDSVGIQDRFHFFSVLRAEPILSAAPAFTNWWFTRPGGNNIRLNVDTAPGGSGVEFYVYMNNTGQNYY